MSGLGRIVRGDGPGLLLAHGAGGSIDANFGPILDGLAARHKVVGPDSPGNGRTPSVDGQLTLDGLADALVATAVEEGVDAFAIAGYSLGTPVAVRAATRHPDRVTALVLTSPFAHPNPRFLHVLRLWRDLLRNGETERLAALLPLLCFGTPALEAMTADELATGVEAGAATIHPGTLQQVELIIDGVDVRDELATGHLPFAERPAEWAALIREFLDSV